MIISIVIENYTPSPKARPRQGVAKGQKVFYSPSNKKEELLSLLIRSEMAKHYEDFTCYRDQHLHISIKIYCEKSLPGDADNYEKFIWDAIQKSGIVKNDKQIRSWSGSIEELSDKNELHITIKPKLSMSDLAFLRVKEGYSYRKLAEISGVPKTTIQNNLRSYVQPRTVEGKNGKRYNPVRKKARKRKRVNHER